MHNYAFLFFFMSFTVIEASRKVVLLNVSGKHHRTLEKRQEPFDITMDNLVMLGGYFVNVSVGTPPSYVRLQLGTETSDTWVFGPGVCIEEYCLEGSYSSNASTTSSIPSDFPAFHIYYVDNTNVSGYYFQDTLAVGAATLTSVVMAEATSAPAIDAGLLGIGFDINEANAGTTALYSNFPDVLVQQGVINTRAYSLWLDDLEAATGTILFGGYDRAKFVGNLTPVPLVPNYNGTYQNFIVNVTSISFTRSDNTSVLTSYYLPDTAILSSATTRTFLPYDIYYDLLDAFETEYDAKFGDYVANCSFGSTGATLNFQFVGDGGPIISVKASELLFPIVYQSGSPYYGSGDQALCGLGFDYTTSFIALGDTFLRSSYVIYDLDNKMVYMAETNFDATGSQIEEISSGVAPSGSGVTVPGITSVASVSPTPATDIDSGLTGVSSTIMTSTATSTSSEFVATSASPLSTTATSTTPSSSTSSVASTTSISITPTTNTPTSNTPMSITPTSITPISNTPMSTTSIPQSTSLTIPSQGSVVSYPGHACFIAFLVLWYTLWSG